MKEHIAQLPPMLVPCFRCLNHAEIPRFVSFFCCVECEHCFILCGFNLRKTALGTFCPSNGVRVCFEYVFSDATKGRVAKEGIF